MAVAELQKLYEAYGNGQLDLILEGVGGHAGGSEWVAATTDPAAVVRQIVNNIVGYGSSLFRWHGGNQGPGGLLRDGFGDCHTLARGCVAVLEALDIRCEVGMYPKPFFIQEDGVTLIDGQTGNVDGTHWYFDNHYWLVAEGQTYDLLLGGRPLDMSAWRPLKGTSIENGYTIFFFENLDYPLYAADSRIVPYSLTMYIERALVMNVNAKHRHDRSCVANCNIL